jgi:hypothetical protein
MLPLALAEGAGLPWSTLWPAAASALSEERRYSHEDVEAVVKEAAAFIIESEENGYPVYRPYHQKLGDALKRDRDLDLMRSRLYVALRESVERDTHKGAQQWRGAHPHILMHLSSYAAKAGMLDELAEDTNFVVAAEPSRLRPAAEKCASSLAQENMRVYQCANLAGLDLPDRASALELAALRLNDRRAVRAFGELDLGQRYRIRWLRSREPESAHRLLATIDGVVAGFAVLPNQPLRIAVAYSQEDSSWFDVYEAGGYLSAQVNLHGSPLGIATVEIDGVSHLAILEEPANGEPGNAPYERKVFLSLWFLPEEELILRERLALKSEIDTVYPLTSAKLKSASSGELDILIDANSDFFFLHVDLREGCHESAFQRIRGIDRSSTLAIHRGKTVILSVRDRLGMLDVSSGALQFEEVSDEVSTYPSAIALPAGPQLLLLGDEEGVVHVLGKREEWKVRHRLPGRGGQIRQLDFIESKTSGEVASLDENNHIKLWPLSKTAPKRSKARENCFFKLERANKRWFAHERRGWKDTFWLLHDEILPYTGEDLALLGEVFSDMSGATGRTIFTSEGVYRLGRHLGLGTEPDTIKVETLRGSPVTPVIPCQLTAICELCEVDGRLTAIETRETELRAWQYESASRQWQAFHLYVSVDASDSIMSFLRAYLKSGDAELKSPWMEKIKLLCAEFVRANKDARAGNGVAIADHLIVMSVDGPGLWMAKVLTRGSARNTIEISRARPESEDWEQVARIPTGKQIEELQFAGPRRLAVRTDAGCLLFEILAII